MSETTVAYITSIVRHALAGIGAALVMHGWITPTQVDAFVGSNTEVIIGILSYLASQWWSIMNQHAWIVELRGVRAQSAIRVK